MAAASAGRLLIEAHDSYIKQTYRNRCRIYACDGVLSLTVPVSLPFGSKEIGGAVIDYSKPWLQQHERAIISAYRTSAFFEYYQDDIFPILDSRPHLLAELNLSLISRLMALLGVRCEISLTREYLPAYPPGFLDLRESIHPKKRSPKYSETASNLIIKYFQINTALFPDLVSLTCFSTRDRMPCHTFFRISSRESAALSSCGPSLLPEGRENPPRNCRTGSRDCRQCCTTAGMPHR